MVEKHSATYGAGRGPAGVRIAPKRGAAAIVLLGAALLMGLGPRAAAMGIPATRVDRLTVTYDDGSGQPRTYRLTCGHDGMAGTAGTDSGRAAPADRADRPEGRPEGPTEGRTDLSDRGTDRPGDGRADRAGQTDQAAPADPEDPVEPVDLAHPAALRNADACAHLDRIGGPVPAVAPGQACSMIYGGPQTATVRGMWRGHRVAEDYRRTNGCEVSRWSRMEPVLPAPQRRIQHAPPLRG